MLKLFTEFIKESVDENIPYFFSRRLYDFLLEISGSSKDSNISKYILNILDCESDIDIKSSFTFVDMTDKNDSVSLIQTNRVHSLYKKSGSGLDFKSWISYEKSDPNSEVWKSNRTDAAVGRTFRKISIDGEIKFSDSTIEKFVNLYKSLFDFKNNINERFEIVDGESFKKWYLRSNYYNSGRGQLGNSCMRYESCQSYFDIYIKNPSVCKLLVLYSSIEKDKISGRAIVWLQTDGKFYMDRVYTNKDSDLHIFAKYAEDMGWETRWTKDRTIQLQKFIFDKYPYMDTFSVLNIKTGILYSDGDLWPSNELYSLRDTGGSFESGENLIYSEYHNEWLNREDSMEIDGDIIRISEATYLEYKGEYAHPREDVTYSNFSGESYLTEDTVFSSFLRDSLYKELTIKIPVGNHNGRPEYDWILKSECVDNVVYYDGENVIEGKTISEFIINNPITGIGYLKNGVIPVYKNGDKNITAKDAELLKINLNITNDINLIKSLVYIKEFIGTPTITKKELYKHIMELDIKIEDHSKYIRSLSDIYYQQSYYGQNPRLQSMDMIEMYVGSSVDKLIKICLANYDINSYRELENNLFPAYSNMRYLLTEFMYIPEVDNDLRDHISSGNVIYKSFQLSYLLVNKILKGDYLTAWYYYMYFKQN